MGHGDWNDGMNRVGCQEKGESVWLAWFSIACLSQFAALGPEHGASSPERDQLCRHGPRCSEQSVEANAWDGAWYRRAYFDDGAPLGSAAERRMCHRLDRAVVGRALRRRRSVARHGRWKPSINTSSSARTGSSSCSLLRLTTIHMTPATSRDIFPAFARTADSIRTRPPGSCRRPPASVRAAAAFELLQILESHPPRPRPGRGRSATRSSLTSSRATFTAARPTRAAAAGRGTPARPPGSTGRSSSRFWESSVWETVCS